MRDSKAADSRGRRQLRQESSASLSDSEELYRAIVEDTPVFVCRFVPGGEITYVNEAYCQYFRKSREELIGQTFLTLIPEEHRETVMANIASLTLESPTQSHEHMAIAPDGQIRWQRWTNRAIFDQHDQVIAYQSIGEDITEQKDFEEQATRFGRVLEDSLNEIYMFDAETLRFIEVNRGARKNLGYSMAELRALTPLDIKPEMTPESFAALIDPLRQGEVDKIQFTAVHRRKDGSLYPVEVHLQLVPGADPVYVAVILDITERERIEEQRRELEIRLRQSQKMEAIGQLAGGVAHDFNNLLTAILGNTELLLATVGEQAEKIRGALLQPGLENIRAAGTQATALTRKLLAFSRRAVISPEVLDPRRVVSEMEELLKRLIGEHIGLEVYQAPGDGCILADSGQIELIVMNLVVNAADAMPNGGRLEICVADVDLDADDIIDQAGARPGPYIELTVSDTGSGMGAETLEHLFEPFFTTKPAGKGTGLGLATVFGSVRQMGGHIRVDSDIGAGSRFSIFVPAVDNREAEIATDSGVRGSISRETILLCEDEELVRNVLCQALRAAGYSVIESSSGEQALELAAGHDAVINLLISDVRMPGMSGTELADKLAADHPGMRVLLISGYSADHVSNCHKDDAATAFMQKPFGPNDLLLRVRNILDDESQFSYSAGDLGEFA